MSFFGKIGHGLEDVGKAVVEVAAAPPTVVVEEPVPGPFEIERDREVVVERPEVPVVVERREPVIPHRR